MPSWSSSFAKMKPGSRIVSLAADISGKQGYLLRVEGRRTGRKIYLWTTPLRKDQKE